MPGSEGPKQGPGCREVRMQLSHGDRTGCDGMLDPAVRGTGKAHQQLTHHHGCRVRHLLYRGPRHQCREPLLQQTACRARQGDVLSRHSPALLALEENHHFPPPLLSALPQHIKCQRSSGEYLISKLCNQSVHPHA